MIFAANENQRFGFGRYSRSFLEPSVNTIMVRDHSVFSVAIILDTRKIEFSRKDELYFLFR